MAVGDLTASTVGYSTMALLVDALTLENSGAATAADDTTSFFITAADNVFYLTKIIRAAA